MIPPLYDDIGFRDDGITVAQGLTALKILDKGSLSAATDALKLLHLDDTNDTAAARRAILCAYPMLPMFEEFYIHVRHMIAKNYAVENEGQLNRLRLLCPIPIEGDMSVQTMSRVITSYKMMRHV